ncbi:MAG: peptidoglycan DD-metalloendopeptidase family protein [Chloroflexi bacterium]|nr:peptidoglycan DD-metalloendopeptidase family protein [Chloroflexota bacterium]
MRSGVAAALVVIVAIIGFGAALLNNVQQDTVSYRAVVPTDLVVSEPTRAWQDILRIGVSGAGTAVPTVALPGQNFIAPTLPVDNQPSQEPIAANDFVQASGLDAPLTGSTATPAPFSTVNATTAPIATRLAQTPRPVPTNPPSLPVPLALDPRDHYWFVRPIDADRTNRGLDYYEFGTDGPRDDPYPIHHGVDMANEIGTTVRAAGPGLVIFASSDDTPFVEGSPSYGNAVIIEHDFGYQGDAIYTLYAHLEAPLVVSGERVVTGQAIGLLGNTGQSGGPHVHFEVRLRENTYGSAYNPVLWLAPYVNRGTVAGRVVDARGNFIDDADVTLFLGGTPRDVTTTYVFRGSGSQVNPDPLWNENFVFSDVPVGRYDVVATINGVRVSANVTVREGLTSFVELKPAEDAPAPTATP